MKTPSFWFSSPGIRASVLTPLSWIWRWGTARRIAQSVPVQVSVPVICVGNLTVGGTGKTPTVISLIAQLQDRGHQPHILTRGYKGTQVAPARVTENASAAQFGDEPVLLSAFAPTWVARDRVAGAQAAIVAGASILVMDDGFQNPGLYKDLSVVVVDAQTGFGNGHILPAGPLREPVQVGLARADLVLLIGSEADIAKQRTQITSIPIVSGQIKPIEMGMPWAGLRVLAFAGIGRPAKFFDTLRSLGADVIAERAFGDHATYNSVILDRLEREAKQLNAQLVTTEKDAVRLPAAYRQRILTLPVRLDLTDVAALDHALANL